MGFPADGGDNAAHDVRREPRRRDSGCSRASLTPTVSHSHPAPFPNPGKDRVVSGRSGRSLSGRSGRSRATSTDSHTAGDGAPDDWRWDESHLAWLREHHRRDKRRSFQSQLRDQQVGTIASIYLVRIHRGVLMVWSRSRLFRPSGRGFDIFNSTQSKWQSWSALYSLAQLRS
jgi:hypothetical protein